MNFFLAVSRGIDAVTTAVGKVAWWISLLMVLIGAFNVVTRYVGRSLGISLGGTLYIALQTYAFDLIFLLGAAYVLRSDAHVRVDIIFSNLRARTKALVDIVGTVIFLIPFSLMGIYFSQRYVATSWRQNEVNINASGLPIFPIKTVIIVTFVLLVMQGVSEIIKNVAFLAGRRGSRSTYESATPEGFTSQSEAV